VDNALGEFVLVAGKVEDNKEDQTTVDTKLAVAVKIFDCLTNNSAFEDIEALRLASEAVAINEPLVRKAVKKARIEQRRREEALS
jgi:hypothetical protein